MTNPNHEDVLYHNLNHLLEVRQHILDRLRIPATRTRPEFQQRLLSQERHAAKRILKILEEIEILEGT